MKKLIKGFKGFDWADWMFFIWLGLCNLFMLFLGAVALIGGAPVYVTVLVLISSATLIFMYVDATRHAMGF